MRRLYLTISLLITVPCFAGEKPLQVYFVDVEGGQATLIVAPSGESLLVDAGWAEANGRDADRIVATARAAGLKRIDYLLITHYHVDHVGGVPQLAARMPIGSFLDHGSSVESGMNAHALLGAYEAAVARARRLTLRPGDKIPIKGLDVTVLTAGGETIRAPVAGAGAANPLCAEAIREKDDPGENSQSIGILIRHGKFRMIDLGDLTWNKELALACPANRAGQVDVYLTTHHGGPSSNAPALVHALAPRVAIMNNAARKGGFADSLQTIITAPGLEDVWQLHYATQAPVNLNAPHDWVANPDEKCEGFPITLSAARDGSFSVKNARNGFSQQYAPRK